MAFLCDEYKVGFDDKPEGARLPVAKSKRRKFCRNSFALKPHPCWKGFIHHAILFARGTFARVAQWIERLPPEQEVAGSTPAAGIEMFGEVNDAPKPPRAGRTFVRLRAYAAKRKW